MNSVKVAAIFGIIISPFAVQSFAIGDELHGQEAGDATHDHLTHVACDDVPAGQKRPEFGCFNIATEKGLQFPQPQVYWHLRTFPTRAAAEADKSATGIVVEENGQVWLSEFGPSNLVLRGGQPVAVVENRWSW